MFLTPFHAAEQHSKERISDSAERQRLSDVARFLRAAQGSPTLSDQQCNGEWTAALFGSFLGKQKWTINKAKVVLRCTKPTYKILFLKEEKIKHPATYLNFCTPPKNPSLQTIILTADFHLLLSIEGRESFLKVQDV